LGKALLLSQEWELNIIDKKNCREESAIFNCKLSSNG